MSSGEFQITRPPTPLGGREKITGTKSCKEYFFLKKKDVLKIIISVAWETRIFNIKRLEIIVFFSHEL